MARKVFINYRRGDSSPTAGRLRDHLANACGESNVFMDVENIPAGVDFVDYLKSQIAAYDIFLVLIGPDWLRAKDEAGRRRIDNPEDPVTMEIITALESKSRVVPVTIDGASMPTMEELPALIKPLARRNAIDLRNNHFLSDVDSLIAKIEIRKWWNRWPARAVGVTLLLLAVGLVYSSWPTPVPPPPPMKPVPALPSPQPSETSPLPAKPPASALVTPPPAEAPGKSIDKFNVYSNLDIYGQDIRLPNGQIGIAGLDLNGCATQCDSDTSCVAFSFDPWKHYCYPKNKIVTPLLNAGSTSATKKPAQMPSITNTPISIEMVRNRRFLGQPRLRIHVSDLQACSAACASDSNNIAFNFLKTASTGANCELFRSTEAGYDNDPLADTGYKYQSP